MLNKVLTYSFVVITLLAGGGIFTESIAQKKLVRKSGTPTEETPKTVWRIDTPVVYQKVVSSKKVAFEPADEHRFREVIDRALNDRVQDLELPERIRKVGEYFLGVPYVDKTLDIDSSREYLVCNLRGLDCVTFFENTLAITRLVTSRDRSFESFQDMLMRSRYRDGKLDGFASRLHYTSDYLYDNARRGLLREVTREVGGKKAILETKAINFMSTHANAYKQLAYDPAEIANIEAAENKINARGGFYFIKKQDVESIENGIQEGDIIGITVNIAGLDCSHTGIAVNGPDGRIHFMHASMSLKKVVITDVPLAEYLAGNSKQTGIMIYRPVEL
jgi:hypothetical protein